MEAIAATCTAVCLVTSPWRTLVQSRAAIFADINVVFGAAVKGSCGMSGTNAAWDWQCLDLNVQCELRVLFWRALMALRQIRQCSIEIILPSLSVCGQLLVIKFVIYAHPSVAGALQDSLNRDV